MQVRLSFPAPQAIGAPIHTAVMRIGFFVPWISKGHGGTEMIGQMMANGMAARGHAVTVFTFDDARAPSTFALAPGIDLVHLAEGETPASDQAMVIEVASRNLDLLVGLHMNRAFARYVRVALKVGLPIVLSEHSDPRFPDMRGAFPAEERAVVFSGATLIHLLDEQFRDTLDPALHDRVRVIPNTIRPPRDLATPGKRSGQKTLLSVSRLVPNKNIARLIDAFAALAPEFPEWRLHIVGDGPQADPLIKQAAALGLGARIDFAGHQPDPYPHYQAAQLFVTPSLHEAFGLTTCEAAAHGLPVVGYGACAGVRGQIVHGETGLLSHGGPDTGSLIQDLGQLMASPTQRARMGQAGHARYRARYAPEVVQAAWEGMFAEAVQRRPIYRPPSASQIAAVRLYELVWGPTDLARNRFN